VSKEAYRKLGKAWDFRKYLKNQYRGCFVLVKESSYNWIVKRIKDDDATNTTCEKEQARRRRFYIPSRKASAGKVQGGQN
jgi:hypothetical protein